MYHIFNIKLNMNTWNITSSEALVFMFHLREFLLADNNLENIAHLLLPKLQDKSPIILAIKITDVYSFMDNVGNQWNFKHNGNIYMTEIINMLGNVDPEKRIYVNTPEEGGKAWNRTDKQDLNELTFDSMWRQITPANNFFVMENKTRMLGNIVKNVLKINPDLDTNKELLHYLRDMRISNPENSEVIRSLRAAASIRQARSSEIVRAFQELPFHDA